MMMKLDLAPVAISTYCRLDHLKKTIASLRNNALAKDSEVYIFSDGPRAGDEEKVQQLRNYLHTIDGFKLVHIVEREQNSRIKNNRGGMRMLLEKYGRIVFLEEDVETAPGFLQYMNGGLDQYKNNPKVFSITGYSPPIPLLQNHPDDAYFLRRFNAWGFGIWKDRFDLIQYISEEALKKFLDDKDKVNEFCVFGQDMLSMLEADANGDIDALDVKAMYAQFLSNQLTLYPTQSLTFNNGFDGTGIHCGHTAKFNVDLGQKTAFNLPVEVVLDSHIVKGNYKFRQAGIQLRTKQLLKNFISQITGGS